MSSWHLGVPVLTLLEGLSKCITQGLLAAVNTPFSWSLNLQRECNSPGLPSQRSLAVSRSLFILSPPPFPALPIMLRHADTPPVPASPSLDTGTAFPTATHRDDMRTKHSRYTTSERWEHHSHPPSSSAIDLRIVPKPHHEDVSTEALYKVSDSKHPKDAPITL